MSTDSARTTVAPLVFPRVESAGYEAATEAAVIRGHAAGFAAGNRDAERELATARTLLELETTIMRRHLDEEAAVARGALERAAASYEARLIPLVEELESLVLASALRLATAIVGHELSDALTAATSAVHRALATAGRSPVLRVRLHPADLALVEADGGSTVALVADDSLERGDAIADTEDGYIDARISAALDRVAATLGVTA